MTFVVWKNKIFNLMFIIVFLWHFHKFYSQISLKKYILNEKLIRNGSNYKKIYKNVLCFFVIFGKIVWTIVWNDLWKFL